MAMPDVERLLTTRRPVSWGASICGTYLRKWIPQSRFGRTARDRNEGSPTAATGRPEKVSAGRKSTARKKRGS